MELTPLQQLGVTLRLSLQRALLGEVGPALRAVTCAWSDKEVLVRGIFDGPIKDEDGEVIGEVATQVAADLPSTGGIMVEDESIRVDAPESFKDQLLDHVVYMRREARES